MWWIYMQSASTKDSKRSRILEKLIVRTCEDSKAGVANSGPTTTILRAGQALQSRTGHYADRTSLTAEKDQLILLDQER